MTLLADVKLSLDIDENDFSYDKKLNIIVEDGKQYLVVFKHTDPKYQPLYVAIVGTNSAGLQIAFARDNTSKLEPEFTALPSDDAGTLIYIVEEKTA